MTVASLLHRRSPRVLILSLALTLASTTAASAEVLLPLDHPGGPEGITLPDASAESMMIEQLGLVSTGGGKTAAVADTPEVGPATASYEDLLASASGGVAATEGPVLVGSGPERETVAQTADSDTNAVVIACTIHGARTDQTTIDQDCVEAVVEAQEWPDYDSTAIGQHPIASAELPPYATSPNQTAF